MGPTIGEGCVVPVGHSRFPKSLKSTKIPVVRTSLDTGKHPQIVPFTEAIKLLLIPVVKQKIREQIQRAATKIGGSEAACRFHE